MVTAYVLQELLAPTHSDPGDEPSSPNTSGSTPLAVIDARSAPLATPIALTALSTFPSGCQALIQAAEIAQDIASLDCSMQNLDTTGMLAVMGDVSSEGIYNAPVASSDEHAPTGSTRCYQALARVRAERAGLPGGKPSRKKQAVLNRRIKGMEEKLERWGRSAAPHNFNSAPVNA